MTTISDALANYERRRKELAAAKEATKSRRTKRVRVSFRPAGPLYLCLALQTAKSSATVESEDESADDKSVLDHVTDTSSANQVAIPSRNALAHQQIHRLADGLCEMRLWRGHHASSHCCPWL